VRPSRVRTKGTGGVLFEILARLFAEVNFQKIDAAGKGRPVVFQPERLNRSGPANGGLGHAIQQYPGNGFETKAVTSLLNRLARNNSRIFLISCVPFDPTVEHGRNEVGAEVLLATSREFAPQRELPTSWHLSCTSHTSHYGLAATARCNIQCA
jgi:hypothetical protein